MKIAIEGGLSNVAQELEREGHQIIDLNSDNLNEVDALVITGQDKNMMNISNIETKAPVIDARGLSAEDISNELKKIK